MALMALIRDAPSDGKWKEAAQEHNWRWSQYRRFGRLPKQAPDVRQLYPTPFDRGANQPRQVGIEQTLHGYQGEYLSRRPRAYNASVAALQQTITRIRNIFERQPRFNYRRLIGSGGQGAAFKMTYQARNNNLPNIDFVLKTPKDGRSWSPDLRKEARSMEKVKRSAHCVQIIHSSGRARGYEEPDLDDSSDDPDADSSGDESVDGPPPLLPHRGNRMAQRQRQVTWGHTRRHQAWQRREDNRKMRLRVVNDAIRAQQPIPPQDPNNTDADLQIFRRDFIFMEYLPFGDLEQLISRIVNDNRNVLIPNEILWSFWLCMIRACIAMAYPPRKFAPGRDRQAGQPRRNMAQDLAGLGVGAQDPSQVLLEDMPPSRKDWRNQRMVHFDIDVSNIFLGPAQHPYNYNVQADANDTALPPNVVPPAGEPVIPPIYNIDMQTAVGNYDEPSEHDLIPALKLGDFGLAKKIKLHKRNGYYMRERGNGKPGWYTPEQFTDDWDYVTAKRDGNEIVKQQVAGRYGSHTNVWQMALAMWQLITYCVPPKPPRLVTVELVRRRRQESYGLLLDAAEYDEVDLELRRTIVNCLKHTPRQRPKLGFLLEQAKRATGRRRRDATDGEIRGWVQQYLYDG